MEFNLSNFQCLNLSSSKQTFSGIIIDVVINIEYIVMSFLFYIENVD
jgi:hypothetical protein